MAIKDAACRALSTFDPVAVLHAVAARFGITELAHRLGKSPQVVYAKLTESVENKTPSWREAVAIVDITKDHEPVRAWASALGYLLVKLPQPGAGDEGLVDELLQCLDRIGKFAADFNAARADGIVTLAEYQQLHRDIAEAQAGLAQLDADIRQNVRELPDNVKRIA